MREWFKTLLFVAAFLGVCLIGWAIVVGLFLWLWTAVATWLS